MIFGKKDHLVGLDIGSSFIKVAELKKSGKGHVLKKFGMVRIAPGSIVEGRILDKEGVADEIRTLFKSNKIREKNVAISTGGHSVVIKTINTSLMTDKQFQEIMISEAEQYIPYDIEDVNIDYQILGESEVATDQMNVLLVAVKKDLVAEYIDLISLAGLNAKIIDVDTLALQNIYEILPYEDREKITLLADVGVSKISLNILQGNSSLMMRDNVAGTHQIIEEFMNNYDIAHNDAELVLMGEKSGVIEQEKVDGVCIEMARGWCSEICEAVNTFQSSAGDKSVEKIVLSGGGVFIEALSECLLAELDADVSIINPFEGLIINKRQFPDDYIKKAAAQAAIALGLALRRVDDK